LKNIGIEENNSMSAQRKNRKNIIYVKRSFRTQLINIPAASGGEYNPKRIQLRKIR